jgi:ElaA protein
MELDIIIATDPRDTGICMALRRAVFIDEQGVAEHEEVDGEDDACTHVLARFGTVPAGAARFRYLMDNGRHYAKIQRVCVPEGLRGYGVGTAIINFIIAQVRTDKRTRIIRLGAQTHALAFYRGLGFAEYGEEYDDAGIPHKDMELKLR